MKTLLFAAILIAVGTSCAAIHFYRLYHDAAAPHPPGPSGSASGASLAIVDTFTDAAGVQHAVVQTPEAVGRRQAEEIVRQYIQPYIDSAAATAGVKPSQIDGYTAASFVAKDDSLRFFKRKADSLGRQTYYYKDKYLTAAFRAAAADQDSVAALAGSSFDFAYDADLKFIDYFKQRRVLGIPVGRRHYYTDVSSSDPRLKIKGVEKFTISRHVPALGFRLQALSSYNIDTRANTLGLGVRFDLGDRFNTGLNYTYNFLLRDWAPTIYAKYDILQFGR